MSTTQSTSPSAAARTGGFRKWLQALGPGIITAALVFGPSKITISSKLGAEFGFSLLWIVVITILFMVVFTSMAARIGIATNQSVLATIREKWGRGVSVAIGIGVFLVATSFQAGNSIGIGIAFAELTGTKPLQWIIVFNLVALGLLFFRSFYKVLEKLMIALICLMLLAFLITLFLSQPGIDDVAKGFVPSSQPGSFPLVTAFIASCFSIVAAFYQCYLIQERKRVAPAGTVIKDRSFTGIFILGLMTAIVMICAAMVLHPKGIRVNSATDMARALEPLFGKYASSLFLIGLFGASFSALVGNSTLGGSVLGDALGNGSSLHSKANKTLIGIVMIIGAVIAIAFGKLPLELIVFAQSITILIVPFIGVVMYAISMDKKLMGVHKGSTVANVLGAAGLLLIIGLAIESVRTLFF
ncbi:Nramp family divalent metal transporter [Terrimonas sp. NA20]|uniref:Nramp family divalent metal transporter n=1 Tax=Terrimonas ginsenosidimutans TaxID=2908004 RepID=A0ABS9KT36_9BACT|nr:Nramp family divalent metal transporter [Terrimonas ginsenosidimutans]MCG2615452.1 Nramp family divalent metal transporter [Terrimonas ginsenosidimutans]